MRKRKWTPAARQLLFERVVEEFGPHYEWPSPSKPARNADKWCDFLEAFAVVVGADSADAVLMQVKWGMPVDTHEGTHEWFGGRAQTAILCQAAALDAGFIRHAPDLLAVRSDRDKKPVAEAAK
jgi:hypothetical protein